WIDALLSRNGSSFRVPSSELEQSLLTPAATLEGRLVALRNAILPSHVWYAWRHRSFGSSANNHLLGELSGLIVATVRWPALGKMGASLDHLQVRWEREVFAQFAG